MGARTHPDFRRRPAVVLTAALTLASTASAQEVDRTKMLKVKAAYLYQFAKFVEWPQESFAGDNAPVVIGVFGDDPLGAILDRTVEGKTVGGRKLVVARFRATDGEVTPELRRCHLIYVGTSEHHRLAQALAVLRKSPVLLVGDDEDFPKSGGMIGLVLEEGRITFHVNVEAIRRTGLTVSAKLLRLATIVGGEF